MFEEIYQAIKDEIQAEFNNRLTPLLCDIDYIITETHPDVLKEELPIILKGFKEKRDNLFNPGHWCEVLKQIDKLPPSKKKSLIAIFKKTNNKIHTEIMLTLVARINQGDYPNLKKYSHESIKPALKDIFEQCREEVKEILETEQ